MVNRRRYQPRRPLVVRPGDVVVFEVPGVERDHMRQFKDRWVKETGTDCIFVSGVHLAGVVRQATDTEQPR